MVFLESHDVVGDLNGGVRLVTAIDPVTPNSYRARKLSTLGAAVTLTAPGMPMIFQGQEMLENQPFDSSLPVDWSKTNTYSYIVRLYHDLISARRDLKGYTPGLEGDQCSVFRVDNVNKLVAFNRWKSATPNQDVVVIANFANAIRSNYALNFPSAGNWYVHFNSDSTNYGPDYGNVGSSVVTASGSPATANITIGPYSALILSQTPDAPPQPTIMPTNGTVNISWLGSYFGWVLDASTSLTGNPPGSRSQLCNTRPMRRPFSSTPACRAVIHFTGCNLRLRKAVSGQVSMFYLKEIPRQTVMGKDYCLMKVKSGWTNYVNSFAMIKSSMTKPPPMSVTTASAMVKPLR